MGIFDFFKSKKPAEVEIKKIGFDEVRNWFVEKSGALREDEKEALEMILRKLNGFYVSLGGKLDVLAGVDIESKKEYERAKLLVRQGLDKYVDFVRILLKNLKAINEDSLAEFAGKISGAFVLFEKTSSKVYERATYLVGNEMAVVRNEIRRAYNELLGIFEGSLIRDLGRLEDVKLKLDEIGRVRRDVERLKKEISGNDLKIEETEKKVEKLKMDVDEIKSSDEYVYNLETRKRVEILRNEIANEVGRLKGLINFKKLAGFIHGNMKEFRFVKNYKDHFVSEFARDDGRKLIDLLESCGMKSSEINEKVDLIVEKKCLLKEMRGDVVEDLSVEKMREIERVGGEIERAKIGCVKSKSRLKGFGIRLNGLKDEVVGIVEEFG